MNPDEAARWLQPAPPVEGSQPALPAQGGQPASPAVGSQPAPARVVCFAHAGGNARSFLRWQPELASDAELVALCPPGKAQRAREPRPELAALLDGAADALAVSMATDPRPVYLFGHSFGALAAFEVARRLSDQSQLRHLVLSGISAPRLLPSPRVMALAGLDSAEFGEAVAFFGGMPPEVLAEPELREFLLPGVQADFQQAAEYRYQPGERLTVPASLINGREDPHVGPEQLAGWADEFTEPPPQLWADGGHFSFEADPAPLLDLLRSVLRADQHVELI